MWIGTFVRVCMQAARSRGGFKLKDRALHVYREASRVLLFRQMCTKNTADVAERLGEIMNVSHESCARLYECSCPELDELVNVCRAAGAIGSRLTGAGWGGYVHQSRLPSRVCECLPIDTLHRWNQSSGSMYACRRDLLLSLHQQLTCMCVCVCVCVFVCVLRVPPT